MLPATNAGVGMSFGMPDPCLTPAAPVPIVVPYPNFALHGQTANPSPNIFFGMLPALNMLAKIPMTIGDEGGVAHPLFKQMGQFTMGNPFVLVNCAPAINLLCPTTGNMMNNPAGAVLVPSVTTTFLCDLEQAPLASATVDQEGIDALAAAVRPSRDAVTLDRQGATLHLRIARFVRATPSLVYTLLAGADPHELVIDLRNNPGGDVDAALELAADFLPPGAVIALRRDSDGDDTPIVSRGPARYTWPLTILVDRATGSAAELFAASLQHHRRAVLRGERTAGKATAQSLLPGTRGEPCYATVATYLLPNGRYIDGTGVTPSR